MQAIASTSFLGQAVPVSAKAARQTVDVKVTATFKKGGKKVAKKAPKQSEAAGWLGAGKNSNLSKWCAHVPVGMGLEECDVYGDGRAGEVARLLPLISMAGF